MTPPQPSDAALAALRELTTLATIHTRDDYFRAGRVLDTLAVEMDRLTPDQIASATRLALACAEFRSDRNG